MCGYTQRAPATQRRPRKGKPRQRAETMQKGSLAQTIDVAAMKGMERVLVGFVAVYVGGQPAGVFWPLYSGETLFGRAGGGAKPEVALNAPSVSARHATVFANPSTGQYVLNDQGARNGTELNGDKLQPNESKAFEDNATMKMGLVELVVKLLPQRR